MVGQYPNRWLMVIFAHALLQLVISTGTRASPPDDIQREISTVKLLLAVWRPYKVSSFAARGLHSWLGMITKEMAESQQIRTEKIIG